MSEFFCLLAGTSSIEYSLWLKGHRHRVMPALRSLVLRLETLVITEHTHSENNDWQEPGAGQLSASEAPTPQPVMDAPAPEEGQTSEAGTRAESLRLQLRRRVRYPQVVRSRQDTRRSQERLRFLLSRKAIFRQLPRLWLLLLSRQW